VREGDLEALPVADSSFEVVTAVNNIFYAADIAAAMRELSCVVRVVATAWGHQSDASGDQFPCPFRADVSVSPLVFSPRSPQPPRARNGWSRCVTDYRPGHGPNRAQDDSSRQGTQCGLSGTLSSQRA
jgi:hypothetical protein